MTSLAKVVPGEAVHAVDGNWACPILAVLPLIPCSVSACEQNTLAESLKRSAPVHLTLDQFDLVHHAFGRPSAPGQGDCSQKGFSLPGKAGRQRLNVGQAARSGLPEPPGQTLSIPIPEKLTEVEGQATHLVHGRTLLRKCIQQRPFVGLKPSILLQQQPDHLSREEIRSSPPGLPLGGTASVGSSDCSASLIRRESVH